MLELVDRGILPAVEMEHLELMSERAAVRSSKCKNVSSDHAFAEQIRVGLMTDIRRKATEEST